MRLPIDRSGRAARLRHLSRVGGSAVRRPQALDALDADDLDPRGLVGAHRALGHVCRNLALVREERYITFYDAVRGRLLIAAGQPEAARERLDTALQLAQDTGMHFYDAELLRFAPTPTPIPTPAAPTSPPPLNPPAARARPLFELRAALDDFELHGQPARAALTDVVSRFPPDSGWPELARAQAALDQTAPKTG